MPIWLDKFRRKRPGFDKLSPNGWGKGRYADRTIAPLAPLAEYTGSGDQKPGSTEPLNSVWMNFFTSSEW